MRSACMIAVVLHVGGLTPVPLNVEASSQKGLEPDTPGCSDATPRDFISKQLHAVPRGWRSRVA